ncbi:MAG: hypothetical protein DYG89_39860 [Caldilinea sp. CFX5]|nr:hypothetical protein [Caldilinea sp. CFX5]
MTTTGSYDRHSYRDAIGIDSFMQHTDPNRLRFLVNTSLLTEPPLEAFCVARQAFMASPEAYTLWLSLMIGGEQTQ